MQSNLSITDMLYNRHLVIADTFLRDRPNRRQTPFEKTLYDRHFTEDICYSGLFFWAPREHFGQNLRVNSGNPMIGREKR